MGSFRVERDTLGEVKVPEGSYYGAQTQRAVENFPISGLRLQPEFIKAQAIVKRAAAKANMKAGVLDEAVGKALVAAAEEVIAGRFADQFVIDVFQAGAGTSQNMNMNEVLANRAEEILGGKRGQYRRVHANDHANMAQSTNDTIHSAIHVAAVMEIRARLLPSMERLEASLSRKAEEFVGIVKCGRTHLQDAVPMSLGQEFSGYAAMLELDRARIERALLSMSELCIGGTAVGTGLNAPPHYRKWVITYINEASGHTFKSAQNLFEAMQSMDAAVDLSGVLRVLATSVRKIADDFRLLGSGPRTGLGELILPAVQPGSSIMPGKVNPVLAEMVNMVCFQVMGCDTAIVTAAQAGQLELNVMMPVSGYNLLLAIGILASAMDAFRVRCVEGTQAAADVCRLNAEKSTALATALSPYIGYHRGAELAQLALKENVLIRELAKSERVLSDTELDRILALARLTVDPEETV